MAGSVESIPSILGLFLADGWRSELGPRMTEVEQRVVGSLTGFSTVQVLVIVVNFILGRWTSY